MDYNYSKPAQIKKSYKSTRQLWGIKFEKKLQDYFKMGRSLCN